MQHQSETKFKLYTNERLEGCSEVVEALWLKRSGHTSVVFNNKIWVLGGYDGSNLKNDVWSSNDGTNWIEEITPPWLQRANHSSVLFQNKLWIVGGSDSRNGGASTLYGDIWSSNNGSDWVEESNDSP